MSKMYKCGADPKVKKTLVRNCEQKIRESKQKDVVYEAGTRLTKSATEASRKSQVSRSSQKENNLGQPSLCTTETIANYLCQVASIRGPPLTTERSNVNSEQLQISSKGITKKLNFHLNDRMYKDLVELNATTEEQKVSKKEKRPTSATNKRDVEPNIEDFYQDEKEVDTPPNISIVKLKFKPINKIAYRQVHELVASFEDL